MKITFTEQTKGNHQARVEQTFSTGESHGDFCLTAYGATRDEAHTNLKQLALLMARELNTVKVS